VTQKSFPDARLPMTHEDIRGLEAREDSGALKTLVGAAALEDQFLRRTAIEVIGRHPHGRGLAAVVLGALGDRSDYVPRTACDVVAQWEFTEAHELVVALLTHPSAATRRTAIRTLGKIWVDADFPLIFRIYIDAPEIDLRREAAWVLRERAASSNWRMLFDAFGVDELPRHRQWACELAESFSGPDIPPALQRLSSDVDGHVRNAASRALESISSRS
jgi:HEAT repeat protein